MDIRSSHRRTLERIFARPTPSDIRWSEIEALLLAVDVEVEERSGSRVALVSSGKVVVVHRPHPQPETTRATVRDIGRFLILIGVTP